jgi:ATP-dependent helicase HrpA
MPGKLSGKALRPKKKGNNVSPGCVIQVVFDVLMKKEIQLLSKALRDCMGYDQHRFRKQIARLKNHLDKDAVAKLKVNIDASVARCQQRKINIPQPRFPEELPVSLRRDEIAAAIHDHQVVIVAGETGSGKTTQIPKICLSLGRGTQGFIGHTQPRRIAARSVAARIAEELGSTVGEAVGYKVRFSDQTHPNSYIKLMTDGILLAELQSDRFLNQYDTLIIDEAHERSLNIDFLLGYLKQLLPKRPDLKLIITSATIDTERFSTHFNQAPIIEVTGRTYPVEIRYQSFEDEIEDVELDMAILAAIDELATLDSQGDILVFLSGEREIREVAEALRKHHPEKTEILPLYSRLSAKEQNRVFQPSRGRRIVLATNVAETSLTIPGIRYVVDPGTARISRYSYRSKVQRLPIEKISQASANQRAGRCGRVSEGVCIRLYSEDDFNDRPEFTQPEIQRTSLASVILQMSELGLGNPGEFPFVDPPDSRFINDGFRLLQELGAFDAHRKLTALGRKLARLPVDPRIGRMILSAQEKNCLNEVLIIASVLTIQDPRERPIEHQQQADEKHAEFRDEDSDFVALLNLWNRFRDRQKHLSNNKFRQFCRQNYLAYMRLKEWAETYQQLRTLVKGMGMKLNQTVAEYGELHQAILAGLLGNIGVRAEVTVDTKKEKRKTGKGGQRYLGARNSEFYLFPGSGLAKKSPHWVMAAELVETSRLFSRQNARIEPEWVEAVAQHLVKKTYSEPHWNPKRGQAMADETVMLYGLVLCAGRRVNYGPIDEKVAREIFIREALVMGRYRSSAKFFQHNQALIDEAKQIETRTRRPDVLIDEESLFAFFDKKIPTTVFSHALLEKWRKQVEPENPGLLKLSRDDVFASSHSSQNADYPGDIVIDDMTLPLSYCFSPGSDEDGVTVSIPLGALNQLSAAGFEWLVPGFLLEKITALLKSLPKNIRKQIVPVPEFAQAMMDRINYQGHGLLIAMEKYLTAEKNIQVKKSNWREELLPNHLLMRFQIRDHHNKVIAVGRKLRDLQSRFGGRASNELTQIQATHSWPTHGITQWQFGDLPKTVEVVRGDSRFRAFPAIIDKQDSVGIELLDSESAAQQQHQVGLRRLAVLSAAKDIKYVRRNFPHIETMCLQFSTIASCDSLKEDILAIVVDQSYFPDGYDVRTEAQFTACVKAHSSLVETAAKVCRIVASILEYYCNINQQFKNIQTHLTDESRNDIQKQIQHLVYPGFVKETPYEWLSHIPRYLRALSMRLDKLAMAPGGDGEKLRLVMPYVLAYERIREMGECTNLNQLYQLRWMLEEYRVSLFAQTLKTSIPISPKRLDRLLSAAKGSS